MVDGLAVWLCVSVHECECAWVWVRVRVRVRVRVGVGVGVRVRVGVGVCGRGSSFYISSEKFNKCHSFPPALDPTTV